MKIKNESLPTRKLAGIPRFWGRCIKKLSLFFIFPHFTC
ncbi:hypothetical protein BOVAB4_3789 [Bacteroides ovatus]|nr:hypothetical protein BOVAB4_3789 [Bacteroides ovatus]